MIAAWLTIIIKASHYRPIKSGNAYSMLRSRLALSLAGRGRWRSRDARVVATALNRDRFAALPDRKQAPAHQVALQWINTMRSALTLATNWAYRKLARPL